MMDPIEAWQCIGCGKLEAPQTCIGVCQDRRVELVYASEYAAQGAELARTQLQLDALQAFVQRVATLDATTNAPAALRETARALLAMVQREDAASSSRSASRSAPRNPATGPLRDRRAGEGEKPRPVRPATLVVR